jgi:hypothetical protein
MGLTINERGGYNKGTHNSGSTHRVYILWSLHYISLGPSAPVLLNKRTHQTCGQPHEIRTDLVLCVDLESNLDLVSMFSTLFLH